MSLQRPQTHAPVVGVEKFSRYHSRKEAGDGLEPCPECGTGAYDLWLTPGATDGRLVCVGCAEAVEPAEVRHD